MKRPSPRILATLLCTIALLATPVWAAYQYTEIHVPGSSLTVANDINNHGAIVGYYSDPTGIHGFLLKNGVYKTIDHPNTAETYIYGISDSGVIVGSYRKLHVFSGFVLVQGLFIDLNYPQARETLPGDVNLAGKIVGTFIDQSGNVHSFKWDDGSFRELKVPYAKITEAAGINNRDVTSGTWQDGTLAGHGFLLQNYKYTIVNILRGKPGTTELRRTNDLGWMLGSYVDLNLSKPVGFLKQGTAFVRLIFPNAIATQPEGVNNSKVVVGTFFDTNDKQHSFIATP